MPTSLPDYLLSRYVRSDRYNWLICLGEGTGAVAAMPLLEMGLQVYRKMGTFDDIHVEQYEVLDGKEER